MNGPLPRFLIRLATMSCLLLSCLTALQTPAFAIAIFNDFFQESLSIGPLPFGTSISFSPGSTSNNQSFNGNALATSAASASPPGSVTALASGFASGPGSSFASADVIAEGQASLFNGNPTAVTFPLTFSHIRNVSSSITGQGEGTSSFAASIVLLDGNFLLANESGSCESVRQTCNSFDSGSDAFLIGLTPGSHTLSFDVRIDGSALHPSDAVSPTPEPASLLLLGTTMAGLALAARSRRRRT
jgi:PEP-CTERM motif-containing protein